MELILCRISPDSGELKFNKTYLKYMMWFDRPSGIDENLQIEKRIPDISNLSNQFLAIR